MMWRYWILLGVLLSVASCENEPKFPIIYWPDLS